MVSKKDNALTDESKVSLAGYLEPDTPEIMELKSLFNIEDEYSEYLSTIEYSIADYYYNTDRKLRDKQVISALKKIKEKYDQDISFFKSGIEKRIVGDLLETLEEEPLTHHEFKLVLDYVLWAIDNRSWVEDKQAYVEWIAYALSLLSEKEEEKYEKRFKKLTSKMGLSDAQAEMLLMKRDAEDFFDEDELFEGLEISDILDDSTIADDLETGFFLMDDDEKFDFLLENGPGYVELVQTYANELAEKEDFEKLQAFYEKLSEKEKGFFPLHFIMGIIYLNFDLALAKTYFEKTLKVAEESKDVPRDMLEELRQKIDSLYELAQEFPSEDS